MGSMLERFVLSFKLLDGCLFCQVGGCLIVESLIQHMA